MAATVRINEYNTVSVTLTAGITNSNFGSSDTANMTAASFPITAGTNSFEKYQKLEVTAMGGSTSIGSLKVWYTGTLTGSDTFKTNARTSAYGGALTFATPTQTTSTQATQTMPTAAPAVNLGIAGSLSTNLTAIGLSDYLCMQIGVNAATTAGATLTINWRYTEVA